MERNGLEGPLPAQVGLLLNLEALDLSNNKLSSLPEEIKMLRNLKVLNLAGNRLKSLPLNVESLHCLETADLSNNSILSLPKGLLKLQCLKQLLLQGNPLCDRKLILRHKALTSLMEQGCQVEGVPDVGYLSLDDVLLNLYDFKVKDPRILKDLALVLPEYHKLRVSLGEGKQAVQRSLENWRQFVAPHLSNLGELKVTIAGARDA